MMATQHCSEPCCSDCNSCESHNHDSSQSLDFKSTGSWSQMNCILNPSLSLNPKSFYISEQEPPDFVLPSEIICTVYHPLHIDGSTGPAPDETMKQHIIEFIRTHDRTHSGNITELSPESLSRMLATPSILAILQEQGRIIGTIITLLLRVQYREFRFLSSYTTFLCVETSHREQGLAMILIRAVMREGYSHYKMQHGYYMTGTPHHPICSEIKSWYRPINVKKARNAGFTLQTFASNKGVTAETRQRLAYHVTKPSILPVKATLQSYKLVCRILRSASDALYLAPTRSEYEWLCTCFDVYIVGESGLFMLFPMTTYISDGDQRVRNAQLALMIGDVLPQAVWVASESNYDLLYGWCCGDITTERVMGMRGLITVAKSYLELYNTQSVITGNKMRVPLF